MKYAIGVTLTEDERRMVGLRDPFLGGGQTASGIVRSPFLRGDAANRTKLFGWLRPHQRSLASLRFRRAAVSNRMAQRARHQWLRRDRKQSAGSHKSSVPAGSGSGAQSDAAGEAAAGRKREPAAADEREVSAGARRLLRPLPAISRAAACFCLSARFALSQKERSRNELRRQSEASEKRSAGGTLWEFAADGGDVGKRRSGLRLCRRKPPHRNQSRSQPRTQAQTGQ